MRLPARATIGSAATGLVLSAALIIMAPAATQAASTLQPHEDGAVVAPRVDDLSAQRRRPTRVRIYGGPRRLAPTAVRQCRAWYAPEYRLSGTVVTPRMQCWWDNG